MSKSSYTSVEADISKGNIQVSMPLVGVASEMAEQQKVLLEKTLAMIVCLKNASYPTSEEQPSIDSEMRLPRVDSLESIEDGRDYLVRKGSSSSYLFVASNRVRKFFDPKDPQVCVYGPVPAVE